MPGRPSDPHPGVPHVAVARHEIRASESVPQAIDERIKGRRQDSELQTRLRRLTEENQAALEPGLPSLKTKPAGHGGFEEPLRGPDGTLMPR
jgi:hypothetical protein